MIVSSLVFLEERRCNLPHKKCLCYMSCVRPASISLNNTGYFIHLNQNITVVYFVWYTGFERYLKVKRSRKTRKCRRWGGIKRFFYIFCVNNPVQFPHPFTCMNLIISYNTNARCLKQVPLLRARCSISLTILRNEPECYPYWMYWLTLLCVPHIFLT